MNDSTTAVAPEALLADIWKEILGVGEVGPDDDFFSLGGDSLLALKVIGAAQEQGLSLSSSTCSRTRRRAARAGP
ncbi:phosphopantetheine-binding protein [Streptomyces aureus]